MKESKTKKRKIAVVTGSRAEYGLLRPVMQAIKKHPKLALSVIVAGMHLVRSKGLTLKEVEKDFKVDFKVDMKMKDDSNITLAKSLGYGIIRFVQIFEKAKPDIVVVLGDRNEALAATLAASQINIPVAHIHGGDITNSGTIDESIRFSISNFAHIHFVASKKSAERLLKIGEEKRRVFFTGSPGIDAILNSKYLSRKTIMNKYNLNSLRSYCILVHNPVTIDPKSSYKDLKSELELLDSLGIRVIAIHPNADAGSTAMVKLLDSYARKEKPNFSIYKNILHKDYLNLLKYASFLMGNSTSGIIEAPTLKTPVINVGERQKGRDYFGYIKFVDSKRSSLINAIEAVTDKKFVFPKTKNPYGNGNSAKKIVDILVKQKLGFNLIKKIKCL